MISPVLFNGVALGARDDEEGFCIGGRSVNTTKCPDGTAVTAVS